MVLHTILADITDVRDDIDRGLIHSSSTPKSPGQAHQHVEQRTSRKKFH